MEPLWGMWSKSFGIFLIWSMGRTMLYPRYAGVGLCSMDRIVGTHVIYLRHITSKYLNMLFNYQYITFNKYNI